MWRKSKTLTACRYDYVTIFYLYMHTDVTRYAWICAIQGLSCANPGWIGRTILGLLVRKEYIAMGNEYSKYIINNMRLHAVQKKPYGVQIQLFSTPMRHRAHSELPDLLKMR